ncbi:hypothetical protein CDD82_7697 [Ophiocordyceps australis]|uniref:Subtelomeric hrmA-associated cluster protein AFUB-079030/YDR124W-like helical bundle domain-containing protein n=1 Tax=Ophiocordyceps australis TaxID=1399860 RepID=A0A2C5XUG3_9HYPO|nr:hypothetical protein CDD82_7697 [Ophiocordyceps australis]
MVRDWPHPRQQSFQQQCYPPVTRHPSFQHDRYGPDTATRQDSFQQDRYPIESSDNTRFHDPYDMHRRQPPMQIDEALRSYCGIAGKHYFVATISEEGMPLTFFSPGHKLHENTIHQFFDENKFQQVIRRMETGAVDPMRDDGLGYDDSRFSRQGGYGRTRTTERRRSSALDDWGSPARPGRKRPRARHALNEEEEVPIMMSARRGIKIGDSEAVWKFYEQRFKNCQQTACKLIAKAWVKVVEPKKQSTHPYTGSDEKAPDWWPKPWGPTKEEKVRHKEPDHLYKRERVHLLAHILRLVVEPQPKQHQDIQKLGLTVTKLEESTMEALSAFFMDAEGNNKKRAYLCEIFKMAKQEERYKNGEIDDSTEVYVMAEDKMPDNYGSENDDVTLIKTEDQPEVHRAKPQVTHCLGPTSTSAPATAHGLHSGSSGSFMGELPVRGTSFHAPPLLQTELGSQQHPFVESTMPVGDQAAVSAGGGGLGLDLVASPHESSRRPSVFSEYTSPGGGSLYTQPWQQASTGSNAPSIYAYTPQPASAQQSAFVSQTVHMNPTPPFMTGSFESSPRAEYEANHGAIFRAGEMPQGSVSHQQGYYVSNDSRGGLRAS